MSFGINRDYITTDRNTRLTLKMHHERMLELIALGYTNDEASRAAYDEIRRPYTHIAIRLRMLIKSKRRP